MQHRASLLALVAVVLAVVCGSFKHGARVRRSRGGSSGMGNDHHHRGHLLHLSASASSALDSSWIPPEIKLDGVSLGRTAAEGLRGVFATKAVGGDVQTSPPLVTVPANLVFEVTNARPPTPFPDFCSQKLWEESMWDQRLAFKLLHELKIVGTINSEKATWLNELPKSYSTPLHWDAQFLQQEVQYPALAAKVEIQRKEWRAFYEKWQKDQGASLANRVSYDDFCQALECVNSRAFSGIYEGSSASERQQLLIFTGFLTLAFPVLNLGTWEQSLSAAVVVGLSILAKDVIFSKASKLKRYVVCPFVDMFNHRSAAISDVSYNYFSNTFELRTSGHENGEQVFISYGKQSNDRLLQYYGFVDPDNIHDSYDFGLGVLELFLKYGDAVTASVAVPVSDPSEAQQRLKTIAAALSVTEVEDTSIRGSSRGATLKGDDVTVRYFRKMILPEGGANGGESDSITSHFDTVTTRALRALYASPSEWATFMDSTTKKIGNLSVLGNPLSKQTEELLASALRKIAQLELSSRETNLEQDIALLQGLRGGSAKKQGFGAATAVTPGTDAIKPNPSGLHQDALYSAISFRIEKKKMLLEIMEH